jgi:hypothetical protein
MKFKNHFKGLMVNAFRRGWRSLSKFIVQDAPDALAFCEFDCRKEQCSAQEWARCQRRQKKGAGALMPAYR